MRVLVTGGSSGLGASLAAAFTARGDQVLICDLVAPRRTPAAPSTAADPPSANHPFRSSVAPGGPVPSTAAGGPAASPAAAASPPTYLPLDVRSEEDWAAALSWVEEHWGGLDVLVNNAGVAGGGRIDVAGMAEWQWITEINLFGVVRGIRTFTPMFKRQRSGRILNVASLAGLVHPAGMASYNAVKAGVVALTETVGHELAEYGVRASVVCPSYFRTGLVDSMQGSDNAVGQLVGSLVASSPVGPDDIAAAVLDGIDRDLELILPDEAARAAYQLKVTDRAAYDRVMRKQAARLNQLGGNGD